MPKRGNAPKRNDVGVKVDAEVIRDAKVVAACRDITLAEFLSEALRPIVVRELEIELAKRAKAPRPKRDGSERP